VTTATPSSQPSPWLILGVVFAGIIAYEGVKVLIHQSAAPRTRYRRFA
jgi:hypothetical protein